jgi:uncharacterized protein (DUF1330 family)
MNAPSREQSAGYLVVLAKINDRARFGAYIQALPPVYAQFGGRYLSVAPAARVEQFGSVEDAGSVVISVWRSLDTVQRFWHSPEYRAVAALRAGTGEFVVRALAGRAPPETLGAEEAILLGLSRDATLASKADPRLDLLAEGTERTLVALEGALELGALRVARVRDAAGLRADLVAQQLAQSFRADDDRWLLLPPYLGG